MKEDSTTKQATVENKYIDVELSHADRLKINSQKVKKIGIYRLKRRFK